MSGESVALSADHARAPRDDGLPVLDALIVEDDPGVSAAIAASFRLQGFDVRCADSLAIARDLLEARLPTVVSVDLNLPDGHGFDFVREVRYRGVQHVMVISGERKRDNVLASLELDVIHYLIKPIRMSSLLIAIQAFKDALQG